MGGRWGALVSLLAALALLCAAVAVASARPAPISGPDPAVAEWTEWPHLVSCDGGIPFDPVAAFSGPTNAERGSLLSEEALRKELAHEAATFAPGYPLPRMHNWRLVAESEGRAEFASGRLGSGSLEWMTFAEEDGHWKWQGYASDCAPSTLRRDQNAITWELATKQHLGPRTRRVRVNLGPGECNDGRSQNARVEKPEFREQNGALLMALWLRPVSPGFHTCVGLIELPLTVKLPGRLGHRLLLDGGTYPPGN